MPTLAEKNKCTGCSACYSVCPVQCIEMNADDKGFLHPNINTSQCINCKQCESVCPIINNYEENDLFSKCYAAFSHDSSIRKESSSGGIFSELARYVINNNGVVFGAKYDTKYNVYHDCATTLEELESLRGAKYSQSTLNNTFKEIKQYLVQGIMVLFIGTPCQVSGLKSFLKKEYTNLLCVDFVCHGIPSPLAWHSYIDYFSKVNGKQNIPSRINLRSKKTGWSKYSYCHEFTYDEDTLYCKNEDSLFMKLFVGDYINRECCADCNYKGDNRFSDLTIGDFWGIWNICEEMDDNKGTSLVITHTGKGELILKEILSACKYVKMDINAVKQYNPSYYCSSKINKNREIAFKLIKSNKIQKCQKFFERKTSIIEKLNITYNHCKHVFSKNTD